MIEIEVMDGNATTWQEAIAITASVLLEKEYVKASFKEGCIEREKQYPTGLNTPIPIAIPHTESEHVNHSAICVLRLHQPCLFQSMEDASQSISVQYVLNLAIHEKNEHVPTLAKIIQIFQDSKFLNVISALSLDDFKKTIVNYISDVI